MEIFGVRALIYASRGESFTIFSLMLSQLHGRLIWTFAVVSGNLLCVELASSATCIARKFVYWGACQTN